jgi:superfamily II DNA/RNA helicase
LDADDSCFAAVPTRPRTRRYAGITTAGRSAKFTLQALYASLLQGDSCLRDEAVRDGYHTLVGYFNSLRELGGALVLTQDDVPASIRLLAKRRKEPEREAREVVELTSRVTQTEIRDLLERVDRDFTKDDSVDVVLATNMISVGVDVGRLALMVVFGQPKGIAEYIQATSRVGRIVNEGLIITVFNNAKARDRSHYESFSGWHSALYRGVEATSVTPFASRSRDRALHAPVVALARHLVPGLESHPEMEPELEHDLEALVEELACRAEQIDPHEGTGTRRELRELINAWRNRGERVERYWWDQKPSHSLLISAERASARIGVRRDAYHPWPTLNSMRNVEQGTPFRLTEGLSHGHATDNTRE